MNTESNTGVAEAYVLNVGKQYQIKGIPLGTADLVNTANFTTADAVQADWLVTNSGNPRFIRNKPDLAAIATTGSAADLKSGVLPISVIPQLPAPTISSGNFQIGSFAVDIIPTVDSTQNMGQPGASWRNIVTRNIAINKSIPSANLDLVGQARFTGTSLPQVSIVNSSANADGTQAAQLDFDCINQGTGQLGSVGFATGRGLFARLGGIDRLNISLDGDTTISGKLTGVDTAPHRLGNLLVSDFGQSTSTSQFAGIGNAVASTMSAGLLMPDDGSVRINTGANATVTFQNRYSTNITVDSTGSIIPATNNAQLLGNSNLAWGTIYTANLNCSQQMNYQGKPIQPIATSGSASDLITGVAPLPRIPNLPADRITYGTYTVGSFGTDVFPSVDRMYNLGTTTTRWKDANVYSLDVKGYNPGTNLGINCGGPVTVTTGFGITAHDQTKGELAGNATIKADVFQSYYDTSGHTLGTAFTGCADSYTNNTALWRHRAVASLATANANSNISTVYALKQTSAGDTNLNATLSRSVNLSIANANQVVLTSGVLRPASNSAIDLGSPSFYWRNLYSSSATISGNMSVGSSISTGTVFANTVSLPSASSFTGRMSQLQNDSGYYSFGSNPTFFGLTVSGSGQNGSFASQDVAGSYGQFTCYQRGRAMWDVGTFGNSAPRPMRVYSDIEVNGRGYFNDNVRIRTGFGSAVLAVGNAGITANIGRRFQFYADGRQGQTGNDGTQIPACAIYAEGRVYSTFEFDCGSDERIKKDIVPVTGALELIGRLRPVTYNYIDASNKRGQCGFIAQEARQVCPDAINTQTDWVPNIYRVAPVRKTGEDGQSAVYVNGASELAHAGQRIKVFEDGSDQCVHNVVEVHGDEIVVDTELKAENVFVFGLEVDDFHVINHDHVFSVHVAATQELTREVRQQKRIIDALSERLAALEAR